MFHIHDYHLSDITLMYYHRKKLWVVNLSFCQKPYNNITNKESFIESVLNAFAKFSEYHLVEYFLN